MANIDTPEDVEFKPEEPFTTVKVQISESKTLYTYKVPLSWNAKVGDKLCVPVRTHELTATVTEVHDEPQLSDKFVTKTVLEKVEAE